MTTEERKRQLFAQPSAAKEVYRPDGHYLNGHIIVRGPDGLWHMYYSPMFPGGFPNSNHHATSEDLLTWTHHGSMLEHGGPGDCDAYEVSDGCIIRHEGRWHLLYNARPYLGASRRFGMAVSDDLWSWTKLPGDGSAWFIPDPEVTGWREEGMMECKDPTIIYQDGTYYLYYIYQKMVEPFDDPLKQTHTGINVATSTDLVDWKDPWSRGRGQVDHQSGVRPLGATKLRGPCSTTARFTCSPCTTRASSTPSETTHSTSPVARDGPLARPRLHQGRGEVVHHPLVQALRQALYAGKQRRPYQGCTSPGWCGARESPFPWTCRT